jgi:tetratricopeptide (TPR) repeat protein/ferredoxin
MTYSTGRVDAPRRIMPSRDMATTKKPRSGPRCGSSKSDASDVALPVLDRPRAIRPSRMGRRRAIVLATVQLLMIAHVVQWLITGRTIAPVEPSESMETVKNGIVNAGAVFFAAALLSTLLLGRWFCGWGCHLVMLQDACGWIMRRLGVRPKPFRSRLLVYTPLVLALYMFVWPLVYRFGVAPLMPTVDVPPWPGFTADLTTEDFWHTFPGAMVAIPFLLVCGFATVYFLGNKGFCTYGCPYGGFFAPLDELSPARIRVNDDCEQCGHCTAVCSSNVRVHDEVREFGMVIDPGCMKCLDCVSVCPNDALRYGFGRPAVRTPAPRHAPPRRVYDLTVAEEIVFALVLTGAFFSVRGVYGLVPMLMAAGIAIVITFIAWKAWRVVRDQNVSLHRFRLRYKGAITRAGVVYLVLATLVLASTVQSGALNVLEHAAGRADERVTLTRADVFGGGPVTMPEEMAEDAARAIRLYAWCDRIGSGGIGLFPNPVTDVRRAWLHACRGELDEAERILRRRNRRSGRADGTCRDIALLMRRQGRDAEALDYYRHTLADEPTFALTRESLATWHAASGEVDEAIRLLREGLDAVRGARHADRAAERTLLRRLGLLVVEFGDPAEGVAVLEELTTVDDDNANAFRQLAGAHLRMGDTESALAAMEQSIERSPRTAQLWEDAALLLDALGRTEEAQRYRAHAATLRPVSARP